MSNRKHKNSSVKRANQVSNWFSTIERNDMAVFYFAGHGIEVGGENFLIPIDAEIKSQSDVSYLAINAQWVLDNIRLVKPDGDVLQKPNSGVFTFENKEIAYSMVKSIEYDGEEQSVKMDWNVEEFMPEGTYIVEIFADGINIGLSHFILE